MVLVRKESVDRVTTRPEEVDLIMKVSFDSFNID